MKTLLVVDDEYDVTDTLAFVLAEEGYRVVTASDGQQALERMASMVPEGVVLDWMMPGMDGERLLAHMREDPRLGAVPVVVMSGARLDVMRERFPGAHLLRKPFDLRQLTAVVLAAVGPPSPR